MIEYVAGEKMDDLVLNFEFNKALIDVVKKMRKREDFFLKKFDLTHFHGVYVLTLSKYGELTMNELNEYIGVDKANTSRAVKDLLAKGYVEKVGENDRKFALKLSKTGKKIAQDFKKRIDLMMEIVLSKFSEKERLILDKCLKKLIAGINEACEG